MERGAAAKLMARTGWLSRQPEDFRTEVLRRSLYRSLGAGCVLHDIGDPAGGVFGLVEGELEVQLENGHIVTIATPGFWVGEASALRRETRRVALVAKSEVRIFYLPLHEFETLVSNPDYLRSFAILTIEHLEDTLRVIESLMSNDVVARVAGRLLLLSRAAPPGSGALSVTQADLASMCGLSRQSVNRALRRLTEEVAITTRYGKVTVTAPEKLHDLSTRVASTDPSLEV